MLHSEVFHINGFIPYLSISNTKTNNSFQPNMFFCTIHASLLTFSPLPTMAYYQRVLEFLFFILFCACCNLLISKYLKGKISVAVERIEMRNKEYPSVTVCPVNSLKENQDKYLEDDNTMTSSEILTKFKDTAWKRNETFYYVSYVTENSPGFECLTDKSSNDPVKPCSFPYVWESQSKVSIFLRRR